MSSSAPVGSKRSAAAMGNSGGASSGYLAGSDYSEFSSPDAKPPSASGKYLKLGSYEPQPGTSGLPASHMQASPVVHSSSASAQRPGQKSRWAHLRGEPPTSSVQLPSASVQLSASGVSPSPPIFEDKIFSGNILVEKLLFYSKRDNYSRQFIIGVQCKPGYEDQLKDIFTKEATSSSADFPIHPLFRRDVDDVAYGIGIVEPKLDRKLDPKLLDSPEFMKLPEKDQDFCRALGEKFKGKVYSSRNAIETFYKNTHAKGGKRKSHTSGKVAFRDSFYYSKCYSHLGRSSHNHVYAMNAEEAKEMQKQLGTIFWDRPTRDMMILSVPSRHPQILLTSSECPSKTRPCESRGDGATWFVDMPVKFSLTHEEVIDKVLPAARPGPRPRPKIEVVVSSSKPMQATVKREDLEALKYFSPGFRNLIEQEFIRQAQDQYKIRINIEEKIEGALGGSTREEGTQVTPSERSVPSERGVPSERSVPSERGVPSERSVPFDRIKTTDCFQVECPRIYFSDQYFNPTTGQLDVQVSFDIDLFISSNLEGLLLKYFPFSSSVDLNTSFYFMTNEDQEALQGNFWQCVKPDGFWVKMQKYVSGDGVSGSVPDSGIGEFKTLLQFRYAFRFTVEAGRENNVISSLYGKALFHMEDSLCLRMIMKVGDRLNALEDASGGYALSLTREDYSGLWNFFKSEELKNPELLIGFLDQHHSLMDAKLVLNEDGSTSVSVKVDFGVLSPQSTEKLAMFRNVFNRVKVYTNYYDEEKVFNTYENISDKTGRYVSLRQTEYKISKEERSAFDKCFTKLYILTRLDRAKYEQRMSQGYSRTAEAVFDNYALRFDAEGQITPESKQRFERAFKGIFTAASFNSFKACTAERVRSNPYINMLPYKDAIVPQITSLDVMEVVTID